MLHPSRALPRALTGRNGAVLCTIAATLLLALASPALALMGGAATSSVGAALAGAGGYSCTPLTDQERIDHFGDFNGWTHRIATSNPSAQKLFNQGLLLAYNYNQQEAMVSFQAGLRIEPTAAMLHWGVAYASAPYMNKAAAPSTGAFDVFSEEELGAGLAALQRGRELVGHQLAAASADGGDAALVATLQHDKLYIDALMHVFGTGHTYGPEFEAALRRYSAAMEAVSKQYLEDADAPALASEALGNLHPWDFWCPITFQPRPYTMAALALVAESLARDPKHPLASHLMVHMTEASEKGRGPNGAGRAEAAADNLALNFPAFNHLTHMASHTYLWIGRYHDAIATNIRALAIDAHDASRCVVPYIPSHDASMLLCAAGMGAERSMAEEWATRIGRFPIEFGPTYESDGLDRAQLLLVWARFGVWKPLLNVKYEDVDPTHDGLDLPPSSVLAVKMLLHYVRTLALAAKTQRTAADSLWPVSYSARTAHGRANGEMALFRAAAALIPEDDITKPGLGIGIYSSGFKAWSNLALQVATARLAVLDGDYHVAAAHLSEAVLQVPLTGYIEPERFYQPPRQCLGWVLLAGGDPVGAAAVYEQDLRDHPENPWSLVGLRNAVLAELAIISAAAPAHSSLGHRRSSALQQYLEQVEARLALAVVHLGPSEVPTSSCPSFADF